MPKMLTSLVGLRFERLVVVGEAPPVGNREKTWLCLCDCGAEITVRSYSLRTGKTKSCGCLKADKARLDSTTHGMSKSSTYAVWCGVINRCTKPGTWAYKDYGGRGIKVCERWKSFENFLADMGEKPVGKTLDRRNNDGDYEPGNCRWSTPVEQANNRRSSRVITHKGEANTLAQWERVTGIEQNKIRNRIDSLGWSVERALTTP